MLHNKLNFNQSSASLQILGLPDFSVNDKDTNISIVTQWKLTIVNKPEIEGTIDHLKEVMKAFYTYTAKILFDGEAKFESRLIDIMRTKDSSHQILLKSTKSEVKPLEISIGNAELVDIVNCFDQLKNSNQININFNEFTPKLKRHKSNFNTKIKLLNLFFPPFLALLSMTLISLISVYFYQEFEEKEAKRSLIKLDEKTSMTSFDIDV